MTNQDQPKELDEIRETLISWLIGDLCHEGGYDQASESADEILEIVTSHFIPRSKVEEAIGGQLGGRFYSTRKLKEIDGLTAINKFKAEIRQKLGLETGSE